ncbi:MAG: DUF1326 domain-containing protein [Acidobacteria bacterium]|nr:DUF1326 domain-containing protein [Acidobacteriota bacterium]
MKRKSLSASKTLVLVVILGAHLITYGQMSGSGSSADNWHIKAHIDEACSCPLFCPCYFNTEPANDYCNFNNVYTIEKGHVGNVRLDGMKVWLSGNLGDNFGDGTADKVVAAFEPSARQEQIDAFMQIATRIYPVKWGEIVTADRTEITITHAADRHVVTRADGKGKVELVAASRSANNPSKPPLIQNLRYFGAKKNNGFGLFYGTHSFKGHGLDYDYKDRNGFTIDIESGSDMP